MKIASNQAPAHDDRAPSFFADGMLVVLFLAFANFLMHLYFNNRYGYFRDEFDYIACGDHLAWGYVDQPPLVPFLVKISRLLLGDSLRSIRFVPALATSVAIIQTGMIARELGGRGFALLLSALAFIAAPIYLSDGSLLTTNCLEPLLWMGCVYFAILAIKRDDPRYETFLRGSGSGLAAHSPYLFFFRMFSGMSGIIGRLRN
jgi:4-amino-4-deoxy-L-arabinose transferase-like glycosyltransferase